MDSQYFSGNRARLYAALPAGSLLAVFSGEEIRKTSDEFYPFFAERNFVYLTGLECKQAVLLAMKDGAETVRERLYILPPDAHAERWTGKRIRPSEAEEGSATLPNLPSVEKAVDTRKELAEAVGLGERTMGKVMQIDENAPEAIKEALNKKELSINKGYDLTRQLQDVPEDQREQAAAELLEYEKAKKDLKQQNAKIDRRGKVANLFCKAYEKAVLLTATEENVRCWTEGTRMTLEELRDTVKESREIAQMFMSIADIIEQNILPSDWRNTDPTDDAPDEVAA